MDKTTEKELSPDQARAMAEGRRDGGFDLSDAEEREVGDKLPTSVQVLHETVRVQGEMELGRSTAALAWSSLAAGLSMGFSALVPALLQAQLPPSQAVHLLTSLGYTVGFLVVVLARQQLFTENTITAVFPLMSKPTLHSLGRLLRLWGIVLAGNLAGATLYALGLHQLPVMDAATRDALVDAANRMMANSALQMFSKGILAGWLIATMVWLVAAAQASKPFVIALMTYLIGIGGFTHIVIGSSEAMFLVFDGRLSLGAAALDFALPTVAGNIVGGSLIFALISHAQVRSDA
jgi:formate/nitrite transporter FocA (FNT family)